MSEHTFFPFSPAYQTTEHDSHVEPMHIHGVGDLTYPIQ